MASWKSDEDIVRDLDILSGIKSPEGRVKSYTSWGRGQIPLSDIPDEIHEFSGLQNKTSREEFEWFPEKSSLEKFPESISRGKKLQILQNSCREREHEVQEQLRAALGPGHSNAFIEASFKQRFNFGAKTDHENLPKKQFEDSEEPHDQLACSNNSDVDKTKSVGEPLISESSELVTDPKNEIPKETKEKRKRKPRRYRNAVLESLEKMNNSQNSLPSAPSSADIVPIFGNKSSNIPPAGYYPDAFCPLPLGQQENKSEISFEYKESEFPSL